MAMLHPHSAATLRADTFDGEVDGDVSTILKYQDRSSVLALLKRFLQTRKHHVISTAF